ncbi:inositol monophosphatase family protein [Blastococcus brunescens]|uniref:Inositol monophosphatase family protein n=1 Tax=Blastococcus brunescens TaxID=1564165 RepID=A0ABZ1B0J3_9ACTN|nr:inositol monophosphatase family protein [Blastococcus sp. BMG 8361]WRL64327.1 inositol monophosphatase family protein [Blastococcus sp. BMG 8361]
MRHEPHVPGPPPSAGHGPSDTGLAVALARTAGQRLLELRHELADRSGDEVKQRGDQTAQQVLAAGLSAARPADAVLSEEATDDRARLDAARVWIIDPLDGTREYSEGRHDWAVHVALWQDGELTAGAVALPGLGAVLATEPAPAVPPRDPDAPCAWR